MKTNKLKQGEISINSAGLGTPTEAMVRKRAAELARMKGRSAKNVLSSDHDEARIELTGKDTAGIAATKSEQVPESERWDPVPGTEGSKKPAIRDDDDDNEGRSDNERLVDEGIREAEHEQMRRGSKHGKS